MTPRRLVVVGGAVPEGVPDDTELVIVDGHSLVLSDAWRPTQCLSAAVAAREYESIQSELELRWAAYCDRRDAFHARFSYWYFVLAGPLVYWERLAQALVRPCDSSAVEVVGDVSAAAEGRVYDRGSFLRWAMGCYWAKELQPYAKRESSAAASSGASRSARERLVEALGFVVQAWRRLKRLGSSRIRTQDASTAQIIVVAQVAKRYELCRVLRRDFDVEERTEIADSYSPGRLANPVDLSGVQDVFEGLELVVDALASEGRRHVESARTLLREKRPIALISDHEYDPVVREVMSRGGVDFPIASALIPEGAQSLLHPGVRRFYENWALGDPGVHRFSLTMDELEFARCGYAQRGAVSGYLGDTARCNRPIAILVRHALRFGRRKPLALINFDAGDADVGYSRPGCMTTEQEVLALGDLIEVVRRSGWDCAITCRDRRMAAALRDSRLGAGATVHTRCPWQALAKAADVLIQRDSSIGVEAAHFGTATVAWNPFRYPLASAGEISRGEISLATEAESLAEQLGSASSGRVAAVPVVDPGKVVEWIRSLGRDDDA